MRKLLKKSLLIVGISLFLFVTVFSSQAYASWGLEKLLLLKQQQEATTPTVTETPDPVDTDTAPQTPVQEPTDTETPVVDPEPTNKVSMWYVPPEEPAANDSVDTSTSAYTSEEALMLELVNAERAKNGLKALQPMSELDKLARMKSQDIIDNDYFSHTSPTYGSFYNMVYNAGIRFYSVGENLAMARSARHAFMLFLGSSGHRKNILNPNFTHIGLGVVPYKYGVVVTQLFIMK